jgi:hypothetical protein
MPLPKRLQQDVQKLSPQQLQALQALLDQLIRQTSPGQTSSGPYVRRAAARHDERQAKLDLPPRVRQVRQARLLLR